MTKHELQKIKQEPVTIDQGLEMADRINAFAYVESSALTKEGIREVFETATRAALQQSKNKNKFKKSCILL